MIHIRKGTAGDIEEIMRCYATARAYMRSQGNYNQWINGYPSRSLIEEDIASGVCYVGENESGRVCMVFACIIGADPTYTFIEDGHWLNDYPYATIHRLASDGSQSGVFNACVKFCFTLSDNIRLDTHADNIKMQKAAAGLGFVRCGIIYCTDGSPRIAYQKYCGADISLCQS